MNAQAPDITLKNHLNALEGRITRLLELVENLSAENSDLKQREIILQEEYNVLRGRHDKALAQLEATINRLKNTIQTS
ncbi:MAG: cell division protein ZapB [Pseudomonadota bacterium]|jgi:predicted  nucleic acid-binding Zn-ribbon protein